MQSRLFCFALLSLAVSSLGLARTSSDSDLCDLAAARAAKANRVPLEILQAIARVETGRRRDGSTQPWPWTINLAGQGYWFDDLATASSFADDQFAQGNENFDLGCFQINLHWHGAHFTSISDALDPQLNANYAAEFLSQLFASEGSWAAAVAAYHSRTREKGEDYLTKVEAALTDLRGGIADAPEYAAAPARTNRFPLLIPGERRSGASLVPMTGGGQPLFAEGP